MKKYSLLVILFFSVATIYAQSVPQGMNYQAVARNINGNVIANQQISLKISLVTNESTVHYTEVHTVSTNQLGLFTLIIGEGKAEKGTFNGVPWSTDDIWMQVSIKDKSAASFAVISNSKLLAVPYAFHAATASQLVSKTTDVRTGPSPNNSPIDGTNSTPWTTMGNANVKGSDRLGSTNAADLVVITNSIERLRVLAGGDIDIQNTLTVGNHLNVKQTVNLNTDGGTTNIDGITRITNSTESGTTGNGALVVNGGAGIAKNLNVGGAANITGSIIVGGAASLNNTLNVAGLTSLENNTQSTATNNGALVVTGGTGIGGNLNVGGTATVTGAANFSNTLGVTGAAALGNTLNVTGATTLNNTLDVFGKSRFRDSVSFDKSIVTEGAMSSSSLAITANTSGYLGTFQNTNDGAGDGIKIKLGRAKSAYTIPAAPTFASTTDFADLLNCNFSEAEKIAKLATIVADDLMETAKTMAGIAVSAGNMIIDVINDGLSLPLSIPDITVPAIHLTDAIDVSGPINSNLGLPISLGPYSIPAVVMPAVKLPALSIDAGALGDFDIIGETTLFPSTTLLPATTVIPKTQIVPALPGFSIPAIDIPRTTLLTGRTVMPKLPTIDLTSIGIPAINIASLEFWGLDIDICLDESTTSPLNNANEFIRFADKNDAQVGSVRGVSVANWASNYLSPVFFNKLRGAFLSSKADKFHAQYHFKTEITTALATYAKIGVEYSSGNGDYAEWLERSDKMEFISAGDIVSVKGGKITKDLKNAEQVMVVSHAPIMLGNMPAEGKTDLGNSIVFIGQAPVKIMGPVKSGDYIIGQINTPGYGIAKHSTDMTIEDFKLAVGRSWDTDETAGIKMANTVIGVHNSSFLHFIKDLKEKAENNDARLKAIEARLDNATAAKNKSTSSKKKK